MGFTTGTLPVPAAGFLTTLAVLLALRNEDLYHCMIVFKAVVLQQVGIRMAATLGRRQVQGQALSDASFTATLQQGRAAIRMQLVPLGFGPFNFLVTRTAS